MGTPENKSELYSRLAIVLEAHTGSRIMDHSPGPLKMLVLHSKNTKKTKPVEKLINYKLSRLEEMLLDEKAPFELREYHICEFLISELEKTLSSKIKK